MADKKLKYMVMIFPTDVGSDVLWLKGKLPPKEEISLELLEKETLEWLGNISEATLFSTYEEALKAARIEEELWHIMFFKVIGFTKKELKTIRNWLH